VTDLTEVKVIADKIISSIAQQNWVEVGTQKITASIGIALYPEHGTEVS
jgi:GGDEF domain-containing protein